MSDEIIGVGHGITKEEYEAQAANIEAGLNADGTEKEEDAEEPATKADLLAMIERWEADPDGVDTCDLLRTVYDLLPGQPDGEFSAVLIRMMIEKTAAISADIYVGTEGGFCSRGRLANGKVELFEGHAPHGCTDEIETAILNGETSGYVKDASKNEYNWRIEASNG